MAVVNPGFVPVHRGLQHKRRVCPGAFIRAANWVAERLGASSRRPRPDGGGQPGPVPVHRALQAHPPSNSPLSMSTGRPQPSMNCTKSSTTRHLSLHKTSMQEPVLSSTSCATVGARLSLHVCTRELQDLHKRSGPPYQCAATGESLW